MANETFAPVFSPHPDFQGSANWSGDIVPGAGTGALINAIDVWVDPLADITANVSLEGGAALIGNQSGFALSGTLLALDSNALYANGAIVNQGALSISGNFASLEIVVQAGSGIASNYGLTIASFENAGAINVDDGATLNISGTELSNVGTVNIDDASLSVTGGWVDGGQGGLMPGGVIALFNGAVASFNEGVTGQSFDFNGPGIIVFQDPADATNIAISGFGDRDEIITNSVSAANSLLASSLFFTTPPPPLSTFAVRATSSGAEILLEPDAAPPCFARGTAILTPSGYVPIENLKPGDVVVSAAGAPMPIRWVGWRDADISRHPRPDAVRPIRINQAAFAPAIPARDISLSPDHALYLHGQLVPVKLLINGITIRPDMSCTAITYFHLELDRHDIIIAENLAVETYLDTGNRNAFANSAGKPHAAPVFGRGRQWNKFACADLCLSGPVLAAIRRDLFTRTTSLGYDIQTDFHIELRQAQQLIAVHDGPAQTAEFQLPRHLSGSMTISSASFVPAEFADGSAYQDDWRRLGLAISHIKLNQHTTSLGSIARAGVHPRSGGDAAEWTDGNAVIEVPPGTRTISLALQAFPKRWVRRA